MNGNKILNLICFINCRYSQNLKRNIRYIVNQNILIQEYLLNIESSNYNYMKINLKIVNSMSHDLFTYLNFRWQIPIQLETNGNADSQQHLVARYKPQYRNENTKGYLPTWAKKNLFAPIRCITFISISFTSTSCIKPKYGSQSYWPTWDSSVFGSWFDSCIFSSSVRDELKTTVVRLKQ